MSQAQNQLPTSRTFGAEIAASTQALQRQHATAIGTMQDKTDSASVASTSTFSSRVSLLKDKMHFSSSSSFKKTEKESGREAREKKMKEDALRSQIRMGI